MQETNIFSIKEICALAWELCNTFIRYYQVVFTLKVDDLFKTIPDMGLLINNVIAGIRILFRNLGIDKLTVVGFMFSAGITLYVTITLIKWVVDIIL